MARPIPRRRSERDAEPDADRYAGRRGGASDDEAGDGDREETRTRSGRARGELPSRGRRSEPEVDLPESKRDLGKLDDDEWDALVEHLKLDKDANEDDVWEAVEAQQAPEEPEEPRGRRGRGRDAEPEEDEPRGRRGRRGASEDEEDKPRGRGGRSSREDDDDRPTRKPRPGFEGFKKTKEKTYDDDDFRLTQEEQLVKFLEDGPFDSYAEHSLFDELKAGQRVWMCIEDDCPICATGHKPRAIGVYNILVIEPEDNGPGKVTLRVLKAGPALTKDLETASALKTGPLSAPYYGMSQTKSGPKEPPVSYTVSPYRERDLKDEWDVDPLTDDELDDFMKKTPDPKTYVQFPKVSDLRNVAKTLREQD